MGLIAEMKTMKNIFRWLFCGAAMILLIAVGQAQAQNAMTLRSVGNGEKVKIAANGKAKIIKLEEDFSGDFIAGGEAPHRFTALLSVKKGDSFYLIAKFTSGAAISDKNAPCGGDVPITLLLIQASKNLAVEKVQTEIYQSCAFNGSGRKLQGKLKITKNNVSLAFDEGRKKYVLTFDISEADKGLQLKGH